MGLLDLRVCASVTIEIAQHFRIGIELHFEFEVLVGKRNKFKTSGAQHPLGHVIIILDRTDQMKMRSPSLLRM